MEDVLFFSIVDLLLAFILIRMLIKGDQRRAAKIEAEKLAKDAETFRDNVTSEDLDEIAGSVRKSILRLKRLTVSEHVFYGTVQASSGLSEWSFSLDFDCRGHLSTQCKRKQDNKKSKIPAVVEDRILEKSSFTTLANVLRVIRHGPSRRILKKYQMTAIPSLGRPSVLIAVKERLIARLFIALHVERGFLL